MRLAALLLLARCGLGQPLTITINGRELPQSGWLIQKPTPLPAQENTLTIDLLLPPNTPGYAYRFWQNRPGNWQTIHTSTRLVYHNLSGDDYQFEVRRYARPPLLTRRFFIENALWQRWWFAPLLFGYGLLVLSILMYLFYSYRIRQLKRVQRIRDRLARDLHDDMGSYLSSISILSATHPADPTRARQNLEQIGQTARLVMDAMSDIVWSINPTQDTMQQVIDRMKQIADDLFGNTDTAVEFEVGAGIDALSLPLERRHDFFLLYKEALTNAARYAHASQIQVRLDLADGLLRLRVNDNGRGFDPAQTAHRPGGGNGLPNLRARAKALSGTLVIESTPERGTRVELTLPV